jgi:hypothetical protein
LSNPVDVRESLRSNVSSFPAASESTGAIRGHGAVQRTLGPGDSYGVFTALSGRMIRETLLAQTNLEVYTLSKEGFLKVMDTDKDYEARIRALYMTRQ